MMATGENRAGSFPPPRIAALPAKLEYAEWGEGPAVLLLHGAMGGYDQGVLLGRSALGWTGYRGIAVSRPGYLGTPLGSARLPEQQADQCAALLDSLGIVRAVAIAISGGGQCGLQFALRHPGMCRGLMAISACSAPLVTRIPLRFHLMKLLARVPAVTAAMRSKAAKDPARAAERSIPGAELRARTLAHPEAGPLMMALQASTLERMAERLPGTSNDIAQSHRPFEYPLEEIAMPALAIHGTADEVVPFAVAQRLAARIPGAELLAIEGGRHVSLFTHLEEIRVRVAMFLGRLSA